MQDKLLDPSTGFCVARNLRESARWITQLFEKRIEESGIKITQFGLLNYINALETPTINEVAQGFNLDRTTLSRNLRPLVREGWITITPGSDKRIRTLSLTPKGREILEHATPYWRKAQKEALAIYGEENWLILKDQLGDANQELKKILAE